MNEEILYHGSSTIVDSPICAFGRDNLDFGKGFYLTEHKKQAEVWACRFTESSNSRQSILNIYQFAREDYINNGSVKIFQAYDYEWLDFIVASRSGKQPWLQYDLIEGGVANDRVIDIVNLYMSGLMDVDVALQRLSLHRPNNQICLLNQSLMDKYLKFIGYEFVTR